MNTQQYPLVRAAGTHFELGQQHGQQAAVWIHAHLDHMRTSMHLSPEQMSVRALQFQPLFEQHCPHLLEELAGLAEGAGITFAEALAVNVRGVMAWAPEAAPASREGCTSFVVGPAGTASGQVIAGQNSDIGRPYTDFSYVLHLQPHGKPEVLVWTFGGMIGYHGLNSAGIANFANDLWGGPSPQFALPHYPIKRLVLECTRLDEVLAMLQRIPVAVNGNYVLCDRTGAIIDAELTTGGPEWVSDGGTGYLAHSNHFVCARYDTPEIRALSVPDSYTRLTTLDRSIRARFGKITVADMQQILRDHEHYPTSICRHPQSQDLSLGFEKAGETSAALIAEPAYGRLHVTKGNPCTQAFVTYSMSN